MIYVSSLIILLKAITVFALADEVGVIPDPGNAAHMARYIVHNSNWTSVSYISNRNETKNLPLLALFSVSDGPMYNGSGIPYFFVSRLQEAVTDLMDNNNSCSLLMSLAQTSICSRNHWDPEDPRCAHVILVGTFHKIDNNTEEYEIAKNSVFVRHPTFKNLPKNHNFFFAKLDITYITVQDTFGGPSVVSVPEYFRVRNKFLIRSEILSHSNINKNNIFVFTSLIILLCLLS